MSVFLGAQTVPSSPDDICPLLPGEKIPESRFTSATGEEVSLSQEVAKGPLVLIFYRGGW